MTTITLRPEHGYVLMAAGALAFESLALGGAVGGARSRVFGEEFKKRPAVKELEEQHKKAFPDQKFCVGARAAACYRLCAHGRVAINPAPRSSAHRGLSRHGQRYVRAAADVRGVVS